MTLRDPGTQTRRARHAGPIAICLGHSRPGFALAELAVVLSMLSVLILLVATTLWGCVRIERADSAHLFRMQTQAHVFDQFRSDVHQALECPAALNELAANSNCLILKLGDRHHITYRWDKDRLSRTELSNGEEQRRLLPLGDGNYAVEFSTEDGPPGLVRMRIVCTLRIGASTRSRICEVSACMGADPK